MAAGPDNRELDAGRRSRWASRAGRYQRLHSLSGVVPIGTFLVFHLWITSSLGSSREIYDRQVGLLHSGPFFGFLEVVLVILPLLYHALYGVMRSLQPREPDHAYDTDVMLTLQRASGIIVLIFVGLHVWEFRGETLTHGLAVSSYSTKLVEHLSSTQSGVPFVALGYLVGIAASVFHLANGMTSFCTNWGFTPTPAARHRVRILFRVLGIGLFALSAALVVQLATGSRFFPAEVPKAETLVCGTAALSPTAPAHAYPAASAPLPMISPAPGATTLPGTAGGLPARDH